jgi:hypothetical protein
VGENRALYFFSIRYASGMDTERSKELWDRLENEPERAYRAFECYLSLPSTPRRLRCPLLGRLTLLAPAARGDLDGRPD